jgi:hypothetical protein
MASNRNIRPVIVTCILIVAVLLGGCSPPLPKTLLLPSDGTTLIDRWHAMAATPLTRWP